MLVSEHPFAVIVYTYATVIGAFVVFVNVSEIAATDPVEAPSVIPVIEALDHEKVGFDCVADVAV